MKKHEIIFWVNPVGIQRECYEKFINSEYYKCALELLELDHVMPYGVIHMLRKMAESVEKL